MLSNRSARTTDLLQRMQTIFDTRISPNEARHAQEMDVFRRAGDPGQTPAVVEELKLLARKDGLWNRFLPHQHRGGSGEH